MTSYVMEPGGGLHASLKEKATAAPVDVYLPTSRIPATNKPKSNESYRPILTPEFSIVSADGQVLGIDIHTGLPKLAVELLPEMEEGRAMGPQISTRNEAASSKKERKSVSFESTSNVNRQRSMSDSKVGASLAS